MKDSPYTNTFIAVADDSKTAVGLTPKQRGNKETIAQIEHRLLSAQPYQLSQHELIFQTRLIRQDIDPATLAEDERQEMWDTLFAKPHPCMRASPLTKTQGWGAHYDAEGKIAIYAVESDKYQELLADTELKQLAAMRSKRK